MRTAGFYGKVSKAQSQPQVDGSKAPEAGKGLGMAVKTATPATANTNSAPTTTPKKQQPGAVKPLLVLFSSRRSGQARRVEGYIAHVLQRRHNHDTFRVCVVDQDERPDYFRRFKVDEIPTIIVIDDRRLRCRLEGYIRPAELEDALAPWLH